MATVKINNKKYNVPELTFKHFTIMEDQGFSVLDAFQKKKMFLLAMGFVCCVTGEEREEAERLIEQHVMGGGSIEEIYNAFGEAVNNSGFFKKLFQTEEKKTVKLEQASESKEEGTIAE